MKISALDRLLLLGTGLLAAYQVAAGIDHFSTLPIIAYTVAFGALLIAALLMIILGFEVLESPAVVVVSTLIPLSLSTGLVWQHVPALQTEFLVFALVGFAAVLASRTLPAPRRVATMVLALVHGIAGLTIFLLPLALALQGSQEAGFALIGVGGALIGIGGLLLSFLRAGKPILSQAMILRVLPWLLLVMSVCFVAGFSFGTG
jgi:hypothetical protein